MKAEDQAMQHELDLLRQAFKAIGCPCEVSLTEYGHAIEVDSYTEGTMLVHHEGDMWRVDVQTPTYKGSRTFDNADECAREIVLCQVGYAFDHTDERIAAAFAEAALN